MEGYGFFSLFPVAVVVLVVLLTRRTALALLTGTVVGAWLLYGTEFPGQWLARVYAVLGSQLGIWVILVGGLFGSLTALLQRSGGLRAFGQLTERICRNQKRTMLLTWLLSAALFIDDWLSILTSGAVMRSTADKYNVPREMVAFLITITASSACVLVPVSSWGVFMTGQLMSVGLCESSTGLSTYLSLLPLLFYPLLALFFGILYALDLLPFVGPMGKMFAPEKQEKSVCLADLDVPNGSGRTLVDFFLPILVVICVTAVTREVLYGLLSALLVCAPLYLFQGRMAAGEFLDTMLSGFRDMTGLTLIILSAFLLRDFNDLLGMPAFVIGVLGQGIPAILLPVLTFLVVTALGFVAGNFWGICAISFPVLLPLSDALGGNTLLTAGAIISATVASSNLCFYGSEATVACTTVQIENHRYARTAIPLLFLPLSATCLCYLGTGILLT